MKNEFLRDKINFYSFILCNKMSSFLWTVWLSWILSLGIGGVEKFVDFFSPVGINFQVASLWRPDGAYPVKVMDTKWLPYRKYAYQTYCLSPSDTN